jgi:hypothetical protein
LGLSLALPDEHRFQDLTETLGKAGFELDINEQGKANSTAHKLT